MKKNIIFKNQLKENSSNKDKKKLKKIIKEIKKSLDFKKDTLHTLSKKFKLNFNSSDLKRFQKFKQMILPFSNHYHFIHYFLIFVRQPLNEI